MTEQNNHGQSSPEQADPTPVDTSATPQRAHPPGRDNDPSTQGESRGRRRSLSTVGELVEAGGNRGALGVLAYLVIGTAFWSLVGYLLDYLVGTQWLVLLGAGLGLAAGVTLAYLHLQAGIKNQ